MRLGGAGGNAAADQAIADKRAERIERLKDTTRRLFVAGNCCQWKESVSLVCVDFLHGTDTPQLTLLPSGALASTCLLHHVCHIWHGAPPWIGLLGSPPVQFGISAAALLGPGRQILVDGWKGLVCGAPDMNSLVTRPPGPTSPSQAFQLESQIAYCKPP